MLKDQIIERLVSARIAQGLTRQEVADLMHRHVSWVGKIENGIGDRATSAYQAYADALKMQFVVTLI